MAWSPLKGPLFTRYLLLTNTAVSCALEALGDYCEQRLERAIPNDWERTGRMAIMGFFLGPPEHYWYRFLDRRFPGTSSIVVAKKVILDEAINGTLTTAAFFTGMNKLSGQSWSSSIEDMTHKFWPVYKMELLVWPIFQAINFYLIPASLRVIFVSMVYLGWVMFLSYYQHRVKIDN